MIERITPAELLLWRAHLARHPLNDDRRLHLLVAKIYVLLAYWSGAASTARPVDILDVAPWLQSPAEREAAAQERSDAFFQGLYADFYRPFMTED